MFSQEQNHPYDDEQFVYEARQRSEAKEANEGESDQCACMHTHTHTHLYRNEMKHVAYTHMHACTSIHEMASLD